MDVCKVTSLEHPVFDVSSSSLQNFSNKQADFTKKSVQDMLQTKHTPTLRKFCDVCRFLNIDPVHELALPLVVIFMCKSKHCFQIAHSFIPSDKIGEVMVSADDYDEEKQNVCDQLLNTIADWVVLFSKFDLREHDKSEKSLKLAQDIENDDLLRCMHKCLLDANVLPSGETPRQRINMSQTAILAFLFMSPRKTPSGKMLEMLYTEINSNARDVELRCLRAMTAFKDRHDDENAYAKTLPIVLRSLRVNPGFVTSIRAILRKQTMEEVSDSETLRMPNNNTRPLLRDYVQMSLSCRRMSRDSCSWIKFRDELCFPLTTSHNLQRLLYFIVVQRTPPQRIHYEKFYTKEMCNNAFNVSLENIDVDAVMQVIKTLRVYNTKIKALIDFRSKCLQGINQKTRNALSIVQVLQLYIASYQQDHIRWECWKRIEKTMNHTINDTVTNFVNSNPYDIDNVVLNLIHSQIHD
jgi:hypothetical protein